MLSAGRSQYTASYSPAASTPKGLKQRSKRIESRNSLAVSVIRCEPDDTRRQSNGGTPNKHDGKLSVSAARTALKR